MPGGDIVGAQAHVDHVDKVQRFFPEGTGRDQVHRVNSGGIVDQDIDPARFRLDAGKGACHRFIVGMIAGDGDRRAAALFDLAGDLCKVSLVASGYYYRCTVVGELARDAAPKTPGCAGHGCDNAHQFSPAVRTPCGKA